MTPSDTTAFRTALRRLETAYGAGVDPARDPVYFDAVKDFPLALVVAAANDLACHHRTTTGRFPITHDWADRCREIHRTELARQEPWRTSCPEPHDDTPPMSKQEFFARLDTLRKKLARAHPGARRHATLTPLSQIANSLTNPYVIPVPEEPAFPAHDGSLPRPREPGDDDLSQDETTVHTDGAADDPDAV